MALTRATIREWLNNDVTKSLLEDLRADVDNVNSLMTSENDINEVLRFQGYSRCLGGLLEHFTSDNWPSAEDYSDE